MRIAQKYKKYSKVFLPLACIPKEKILKFHRSKWKKIQKLIFKDQVKKNNLKFKNFGKVFCSGSRWERIFFAYRNQLVLKKIIQTLFYNAVSNKQLKNIYLTPKKKNVCLQWLLYKLEYRVDILLSRLHFFNTSFLVKKSINAQNIFRNSLKIKNVTYLLKGDILFINTLTQILFATKLKDVFLFHTFIEIDYYTNQVVIVKDLHELTEKDCLLLSREFYNVLNLKDYLSY